MADRTSSKVIFWLSGLAKHERCSPTRQKIQEPLTFWLVVPVLAEGGNHLHTSTQQEVNSAQMAHPGKSIDPLYIFFPFDFISPCQTNTPQCRHPTLCTCCVCWTCPCSSSIERECAVETWWSAAKPFDRSLPVLSYWIDRLSLLERTLDGPRQFFNRVDWKGEPYQRPPPALSFQSIERVWITSIV